MLHHVINKARPPSNSTNALGAFVQRWFPALGRRSALGGALEQLASLPLTPQSSLVLVRFHQETLLLGITPQSIVLLSKEQEARSACSRSSAEGSRHSDDNAAESADR